MNVIINKTACKITSSDRAAQYPFDGIRRLRPFFFCGGLPFAHDELAGFNVAGRTENEGDCFKKEKSGCGTGRIPIL